MIDGLVAKLKIDKQFTGLKNKYLQEAEREDQEQLEEAKQVAEEYGVKLKEGDTAETLLARIAAFDQEKAESETKRKKLPDTDQSSEEYLKELLKRQNFDWSRYEKQIK